MKHEIIRNYSRNTAMTKMIVGDLDPKLTAGASNNVGWILAHLVTSRGNLIRVLGGTVAEQPYEKDCGRGVEKNQEFAVNMAEVRAEFETRGDMINELLTGATAEDLAKPLGRTLPDGGADAAAYASFLSWHESFHFGQIDMIKVVTENGGIK